MSKTQQHMVLRSSYEDFEASILPCLEELFAAAMRVTGSTSEADDLVQDTVTRAWVFWDRFEPGTNAAAWMHRIMKNTFINTYRRRKREREMLRAAAIEGLGERFSESLGRRAAADGMGDEVSEALEALPEEFRSVVQLVDLDDLSYHEVAEALGCPVGTVMSRLHRGRRVLKRRLRGYAAHEGYIASAA